MNKFEYLHESVDQFFMEKKTREEYTVERFKKKYNFVPDYPGSKTGKITMYGKTFEVDLDTKNKIVNVGGALAPRQLMADLTSENGKIFVDDMFFKLKNDKRRESVLAHELGHQELHNTNKNSKLLKKELLNPAQYGTLRKNLFTQGKSVLRQLGMDDTVDKETRKEFNSTMDDRFKDYKELVDKNKNNPKAKEREKMINHLRKYEKNGSDHTNTMEFEADRVAANRAGTKTYKKGLNELAKKSFKTKNMKNMFGVKNPDDAKALSKYLNKNHAADMSKRLQALKDEKLKNSKLYK